jgi:hypothetical protein
MTSWTSSPNFLERPATRNASTMSSHLLSLGLSANLIFPGDDDKDSEAEKELQALVEGLDIKDAVTQRELEDSDEGEENDDGIEGWAEERAKLSEADRKAHDDSVRPV